MDSGGLAQTAHPSFASSDGLPMPSAGLASRRGGQNIKPLSFDALRSASDKENGAPTPRTSRSHLLAGLRTAPKSATAATFPAPPAGHMRARNSMAGGFSHNDNVYNGPKTSLPAYGQQQSFGGHFGLHYTPEQVLAPPEIQIDEQTHEQLDPDMYARLMATNVYLAQQQQRLQQQLMSVQAAQQQFQTLNINASQSPQQVVYQQQLLQQQLQQQQLRNLQQQMMANTLGTTGSVYTVVDPLTGQQTYYLDQAMPQFVDQYGSSFQHHQQPQHQQGASLAAPCVQVSPPAVEAHLSGFRNPSPPRRYDSPVDQPAPLPPPSANAVRRGHKQSSSLANVNASLSVTTQEVPKSAGPKSAHFPLTPMTGGYGPGQARAGEHPIRQPRGPPSFDELASKPTSKHEGSKNFATRTRRSALHNLMRAGISRRQVTATGSSGSISPISESAEEAATPLTDDDSDSGRSGSGSLNGDDVECSLPSSRTSTGSWGAIGSDRPGSRQKARQSVDSLSATSDSEATNGSFADVFKSAAKTPSAEGTGQRKAQMLVLTSAEKRRSGIVAA